MNDQTEDNSAKKTESVEYVFRPQGSLAILALGDVGLCKWRAVREAAKLEKEQKKNEKQAGNNE
jgi:hypothetical protein